jgi:hypothetical protein
MEINKQRTGVTMELDEVPRDMAAEIAQVGAIVNLGKGHAPGDKLNLGGHPFRIVSEISREEFLVMVGEAGLPVDPFRKAPEDAKFYQVSTD